MLARVTMTAAFQRIRRRMRFSIHSSPGNRGSSSGAIEDSLKEILTAHTPVAADQRLQGLNPLAGLLRIHISNLLNQFSAHRSYLIETIYHRSSGALWEVPEDSGQWPVVGGQLAEDKTTGH